MNATSGDGFTPLHLAAFFGQTDAVRLLLARGAARDLRGQGWMTGTRADAAAAGGHTEIVRMLLEAGVGPERAAAQGLHAAACGGAERATWRPCGRCSPPAPIRRSSTRTGVTALQLAEKAGDLVAVETCATRLG